MKTYFFAFLFCLLALNAFAIPDNSMSISPSATDNTVITAADENSRNSEVASKFNAHSHTDISHTGETLNIGSGIAGNKVINANNADSTKPYIQYDDSNNKWVISTIGGSTGVSIHDNAVYIHGNAAKLIMGQPDGGCSSCGVDNAGTTWACVDTTCPQ